MNNISKTLQTELAKTQLRKMLKPGRTVFTILNHCSASGMSRSISLVISDKKDGIFRLDYLVAPALGYTLDIKKGGLKVSGCGMDMGFSLVYNLGMVLWPEGTKKPHVARNGEPGSSGGYALKHKWI